MSTGTFAERIRPHVEAELQQAAVADAAGKLAVSFHHLEQAHVLGQISTLEHVRVHMAMLNWAVRHRRAREVCGQALRIVGAATKTAFGWVPAGNTGGANVSPFKSMPVPPDLKQVIEQASRPASTL